MHLEIKQDNDRTEQVSSACIDKLYNLSKNGLLDATSDLRGSINATSAYEDAVTFLNTMWGPDLIVTASSYYIRFADPEVLRVLTVKGIVPEGEGLTVAQAAQVSIGQATRPGPAIFYQNTTIETFDEFKYFTRWNTRQTDIYAMFRGCTNLISLDLTNVVSLAYDFCRNCPSLTHFHGIDSEEGVLELNELITPTRDNPHSSFLGCTGLKVVKSLGNLTKMLACLFQDCNNITTVYQSVLDTFIQCTDINSTYSAFNGCSKLENFVQYDGTITSALSLPNLTGILGESSFKGCAKITSIASLGSIYSIGNNAFENCTSLATINFPNTLTSVGENAFNNTAWYNNQPNGAIIIGNKILYKVKGSVGSTYTIPNNVVDITANAFNSINDIEEIVVPNSITFIPKYCFKSCSNLTTVTLPNTITSMSTDVFYGDSKLTTVNIPTGLTSIPARTF